MIFDSVLLIFGISLSVIPPHFFFQKLFDYVLSIKSRALYASNKPAVYRATKGYFWFASHLLMFFQSLLILVASSRLFGQEFV